LRRHFRRRPDGDDALTRNRHRPAPDAPDEIARRGNACQHFGGVGDEEIGVMPGAGHFSTTKGAKFSFPLRSIYPLPFKRVENQGK
jgi:hypothetical protein